MQGLAPGTVVILGTGGTIAGTAASASENLAYTSAQLGVAQLVAAVPALRGRALLTEQVAQVDSKDMGPALWHAMAVACEKFLALPQVQGVVLTHGTDTLEETAWVLHRLLRPVKPIVLTAAMRPATSAQADGPQNLADAVAVAADPQAHGVLAVLAGKVWPARGLCKRHTYALDAFDAGEAGPVAVVVEGQLRWQAQGPAGAASADEPPPLGLAALRDVSAWPRVDVLASHAGADGALLKAWIDTPCAGPRGLLLLGVGNAQVHENLEAALQAAEAAGITVWRHSRTGSPVYGPAHAGAALPWPQARVELWLQLLLGRRAR
jgi:L-asparaginase